MRIIILITKAVLSKCFEAVRPFSGVVLSCTHICLIKSVCEQCKETIMFKKNLLSYIVVKREKHGLQGQSTTPPTMRSIAWVKAVTYSMRTEKPILSPRFRSSRSSFSTPPLSATFFSVMPKNYYVIDLNIRVSIMNAEMQKIFSTSTESTHCRGQTILLPSPDLWGCSSWSMKSSSQNELCQENEYISLFLWSRLCTQL